jgi:N-acyl-D-amino-acid deacylase
MTINLASFMGHITLREVVGVTDYQTPSTGEQLNRMLELAIREMEAGALGISFGPFYGPGTTYEEMVALSKKVSSLGGCAASHARNATPPEDVEAVVEAISTAREADIPFIISHMGGPTFGHKSTGAALELITEAWEEGLKVISDFHPYDAFCTFLAAAVFDASPVDRFLELVDARISDIEAAGSIVIDGEIVMKAGEAFTSVEQFNALREKVKASEIPDPFIIGHVYKPHKTWLYYSFPYTMVENDGSIYIDPTTGKYAGHPRGAGSFARFLGYWVRERGVCDLMTALAKTSTLAAVWLGLENKGRVSVGADADLTLFDPETIVDKATYAEPGIPSGGIPYVILNGVLTVAEGELTGNTGGKVIRRTWTIPGKLLDQGGLPGAGVEDLGGG